MKLPILLLLMMWAVSGQDRPHHRTFPDSKEEDIKLPNGKSQKEEIVKEDYKRNLEDATELAKLAEELKTDIEKNDRYVVSVKTLKKTDDIERLVKNIRGRLKRY